jgi:anti-sigma B factor antagonist
MSCSEFEWAGERKACATRQFARQPLRGSKDQGDLLSARESVEFRVSQITEDVRYSMALRINEKESEGISILELSGRIVLGDESNQLRTKIKEVLGKGKTRLILDLANVGYIDSAGLGTLVAGYTSAQNQGASMKLANLTKKFDEQLHITKLVTIFEVHETVADAVKSFQAAGS